eukprot:5150466-Pyramimonas_sp.AAC.1
MCIRDRRGGGILLAASRRDPRFSAGTLQRGVPIPRCCICFLIAVVQTCKITSLTASDAVLRAPPFF